MAAVSVPPLTLEQHADSDATTVCTFEAGASPDVGEAGGSELLVVAETGIGGGKGASVLFATVDGAGRCCA